MPRSLVNKDRLFPADSAIKSIAKRLYAEVESLPIISPHGHTDPAWFAENEPFDDPSSLLLAPDHYLYRMLYSQGISMSSLGVPDRDGNATADSLTAWRSFADNYFLFRGTPSAMWLDHVFSEVFGLEEPLTRTSADAYFETISNALRSPEFRPRALFDSFNIEVLATTESPLDQLQSHRKIRESNWSGRVITTYRPDPVVDPGYDGFADNLRAFGDLTNEDVSSWSGYLAAHHKRREYFKTAGATATDHGHPTAQTADLSVEECESLYDRVWKGQCDAAQAEQFRAQMLTEMAKMSIDDGLVMQIHAGSYRNHNQQLMERFGRDKGADIPQRVDFVNGLEPLLSAFGNDRSLSIILFTLDESNYSRELAPLAGHYPCLKIGPAWWFYDSPDGMRRYRELTTETAGFYNTVGFNDDTRAFLSIPARHDVARRVDCGFLGRLVSEHRIREEEAVELAVDLAYGLPKRAYRLDTDEPSTAAVSA